MGRSWPGRRNRAGRPNLSASERRAADRDATDLAEGEEDVTVAYSRGGPNPPDPAGVHAPPAAGERVVITAEQAAQLRAQFDDVPGSS